MLYVDIMESTNHSDTITEITTINGEAIIEGIIIGMSFFNSSEYTVANHPMNPTARVTALIKLVNIFRVTGTKIMLFCHLRLTKNEFK